MIDHMGITVSDYEKSKKFYMNALGPIGYEMLMEVPREYTDGKGVCGLGVSPTPDFWITEGTPNKPHVHVAFRVNSKEQVDAFYKAAIAAGGRDNGKPGPRPHYHEKYYGGFILDPDGHNIEAVFHG